MISSLSHPAMDCRVLVLNKHYMALRVISAKRAFSLLCRDLAEVIFATTAIMPTMIFSLAELSRMKTLFKAVSQDWISTVILIWRYLGHSFLFL